MRIGKVRRAAVQELARGWKENHGHLVNLIKERASSE